MSINPQIKEKLIDKEEPDAKEMLRLLALRHRRQSEALKKYAEWIISQADDSINVAIEIENYLN